MPDPVDNAGSRIRSGASNRDLVRSAIVPVGLAPCDEAIPLLGILEANDRPGFALTATSEGLDAMVAVLQHQLVVPVGDDDR